MHKIVLLFFFFIFICNTIYAKSYCALVGGYGGKTKSASIALELGKIRKNFLTGFGASASLTSDISEDDFFDYPCPHSYVNYLGLYKLGPEFEIYLKGGQKIKNKLYIAMTSGYSWQETVNLYQSNATFIKYNQKSDLKNYLSFSGQLMILLKKTILNIGYHNRRGLIFGLSLEFK